MLRNSWIFAIAISTGSVALAQSGSAEHRIGYRYDTARRLTGIIMPDPDSVGPLPHPAVRNTYDGAGRLIKIERGSLSIWYDAATQPASWPGFVAYETVTMSYNQYGRKIQEVVAGGSGVKIHLKQFSYDAWGRLQCVAVRMDPANFNALPASACVLGNNANGVSDRIERYSYSPIGQILKMEEGIGTLEETTVATYTYSPNGLKTSLTDGRGFTATMRYDGHDRQDRWFLPSPTSPGVSSATDYESYSYDPNGNRTLVKKRSGAIIYFTYDSMDRLTKKSPIGGPNVFYGYDLRGLQIYARFESSTGEGVTNRYDGLSRLVESTTNLDGFERSITYRYDAFGNRTRITHPDGNWFGYSFDGLDRLIGITENGTSIVNLTYNARGKKATLARGGVTSTFSYDAASQLVGYADDLEGGAGDVSTVLEWNAAGQLTSLARDNDAYAYDGFINLNRNYAVNGLNQYTQVGNLNFCYAVSGNLRSDGKFVYAYDVENRLVKMSQALSTGCPAGIGSTVATLRWDPLGRLYEVTEGSEDITFLYDGDELIGEFAASGVMLRRYVHGLENDDPLIWYEGLSVAPSARRSLQTDGQGTVISVAETTNASLVAINVYDEYGIPGAGNVGRFQFTGQTWLPSVGLYHYKARMYSPTLGRFLQTDPVGYDAGVNLYGYVVNDPINLVDTSGQAPNRSGATYYEDVARRITLGGLASVAANGTNLDRYFYTENYGWVDLRHFATAAGDVIDGRSGVVEETLGYGNEIAQWLTEWGDDYRSGFSPEDLPSNSAGIDFGQYARDNPSIPIATLFRRWAQKNGSPAGNSREYRQAVQALPREDPAARGGVDRGSSNVSSTPAGTTRSNDNGSGSNTSNGMRGCVSAPSPTGRVC